MRFMYLCIARLLFVHILQKTIKPKWFVSIKCQT